MATECARCGTRIAPGNHYCRKCQGWAEQLRALTETAVADAALLNRAASESLADIARSEGVSRQAVQQRIVKARARQEKRAALSVTG